MHTHTWMSLLFGLVYRDRSFESLALACGQCLYFLGVKFQIEGLQERLKNKDGTIERKSKESQAASSDKRRLESEVAELKDQLDTKERKISVLQRKVGPCATQRNVSIAIEKSPSLKQRKVHHCYREQSVIVRMLQRKVHHCYRERCFIATEKKSVTVLHRKGLLLIIRIPKVKPAYLCCGSLDHVDPQGVSHILWFTRLYRSPRWILVLWFAWSYWYKSYSAYCGSPDPIAFEVSPVFCACPYVTLCGWLKYILLFTWS